MHFFNQQKQLAVRNAYADQFDVTMITYCNLNPTTFKQGRKKKYEIKF